LSNQSRNRKIALTVAQSYDCGSVNLRQTMKKTIPLLLLFALTFAGCQGVAFTTAYLLKGTDVKPKYDILLKEEKRVAIVPRSVYSNAYELQNVPQEIARNVNNLLDDNIRHHARMNYRNKKLTVVEQSKVEAWLDSYNNDFDSFAEVGKDKSINADIVIGFDVIGFQIRDPQNAYLVQGKCQVQVKAIDCATGKILASETLTIVDPPSMPISGGPHVEALFRPQFVQVVAQKIAALFHYHDPNKLMRMDADNIEMHRL